MLHHTCFYIKLIISTSGWLEHENWLFVPSWYKLVIFYNIVCNFTCSYLWNETRYLLLILIVINLYQKNKFYSILSIKGFAIFCKWSIDCEMYHNRTQTKRQNTCIRSNRNVQTVNQYKLNLQCLSSDKFCFA